MNPYLERRGREKNPHGRKSEKRVSKSLGARLQPASGALDAKGDMKLPDWLIEAKSTVNGSISIKKEWLEKITREALESNRTPMLVISFVTSSGETVTQDWAVIPLVIFKELSGI